MHASACVSKSSSLIISHLALALALVTFFSLLSRLPFSFSATAATNDAAGIQSIMSMMVPFYAGGPSFALVLNQIQQQPTANRVQSKSHNCTREKMIPK